MKRMMLLAATLLMAACGKDDFTRAVSLPGIGVLVVTNTPDYFSLSAGGANHSQTKDYIWNNSDDQANIRFSDGLADGTVRLEIYDAAGTPVHDNTYVSILGGSILAVTRPGGTPGDWLVRFTMTNATWGGTIELTADTLDDPDFIDISSGYIVDSATLYYEVGWTDGPAQVDVANAPASGTVRIRVWDGSGAAVYDKTFIGPAGGSVLEDTLPGVAGVWAVRVDFDLTVDGGALHLSQTP